MAMKQDHRRGAASLLIWALLAGFIGVPSGEIELFKNNGFEDKLTDWRPLDMSRSCKFEIDKKVKKGGKASVRIERGDGGRPDFLKQFVDLPSDAGKVTFTAMVRVDKPGSVRTTLLFSDENDESLQDPEIGVTGPTRKKWKKLSGTFDVPEGASSVGVNFWFTKEGTVWLDDVSLQWDGPSQKAGAGKAASLTLDNGDFGKGIEGWTAIDLGDSSTKGRHAKGIGKGCLMLERKGRRLFPLGGYEARAERSKREKRVKLSFSARSEKGARAFVSLQALGPGGGLLASERYEVEGEGKELQPGRLELKAPPGTAQVAVVASIAGDGKAWFDDFELEGK